MNNISRPVRLQYKNVVKKYGKGKKTKSILKDVNLELIGGECTLITGKNGSGKSTLLRILGGLLKPDSGIIDTGLISMSWKKYRKAIRHDVMYLYQEPYMFDGTVRQNLTYALNKNQPKKSIDNALEWAELEHRSETQAKCLSGGERQRVALAQAWLKQPAVLLLDEPTANMDNKSRNRTEELLSTFKDSETALYIASHDPNHFHRIMDRRLLLEDGCIIDADMTDLHLTENTLNINQNIAVFPQRKN
jgi:tungstate transport system ATP-binding protein